MNQEKRVISIKISENKFQALDKYCKFKGISKQEYLEPIVLPYLEVLMSVDVSILKREVEQ